MFISSSIYPSVFEVKQRSLSIIKTPIGILIIKIMLACCSMEWRKTELHVPANKQSLLPSTTAMYSELKKCLGFYE